MKEPASTRIFLARHGQSEWNGKKRVSGQLDGLKVNSKYLYEITLRDEPSIRTIRLEEGRIGFVHKNFRV